MSIVPLLAKEPQDTWRYSYMNLKKKYRKHKFIHQKENREQYLRLKLVTFLERLNRLRDNQYDDINESIKLLDMRGIAGLLLELKNIYWLFYEEDV